MRERNHNMLRAKIRTRFVAEEWAKLAPTDDSPNAMSLPSFLLTKYGCFSFPLSSHS